MGNQGRLECSKKARYVQYKYSSMHAHIILCGLYDHAKSCPSFLDHHPIFALSRLHWIWTVAVFSQTSSLMPMVYGLDCLIIRFLCNAPSIQGRSSNKHILYTNFRQKPANILLLQISTYRVYSLVCTFTSWANAPSRKIFCVFSLLKKDLTSFLRCFLQICCLTRRSNWCDVHYCFFWYLCYIKQGGYYGLNPILDAERRLFQVSM